MTFLAQGIVFFAAAVGMGASAAVPNLKLNNGVQFPAIAAGTWQYNTSTAEASVAEASRTISECGAAAK